MEFKYSVILVCLTFSIFLIVKEVKRGDKSRLMGRLLASIIMVASFALLIVPIRYTVKKERIAGEINFYTERTNPFGDLMYHLKLHPEINKINVYGFGLTNYDLTKLKDYELSFHPSPIPSGFISASWPKKIKASEKLVFQGIYQNQTNRVQKVKLFGLGTSLDSLRVKANSRTNFSFTCYPKQLGKAVFGLVALQGKDTIAAEPLPFEVEGNVPIHVLMLASFPDFEYKFLKNWLFENQFKVAFRSQISKNKYNTEFLNRKALNLNQINQPLLNDIDVAIIDEGELNPQLRNAVANGMGLIVRANAIKSMQNHQPLLTDTAGKISVDSELSGMGKIVTTHIASTYQWLLAGEKVKYSQFWSLLLTKALRKKVANSTYNFDPQWPTVGEKTRLIINLSTNEPPLVWIDSISIAPRQNMELPFVWDGFFWPKTLGWTSLSINNKTENIYNYRKTDWNVAKNFEKLTTTTDFVNNQQGKGVKDTKIEYVVSEELSKWWFFAAFLISISFLWYEQRFLANE